MSATGVPADFADDWAADRSARAAKAEARRSDPGGGLVDPEAHQRHLARRLELMSAGAVDLER